MGHGQPERSTVSDTVFGQSLVQAGTISACQLRFALAFQRSWGGRLEGVLVKLGLISSSQLASLARNPERTPHTVLVARNEPMSDDGRRPQAADGRDEAAS
jgi:hypothetical protein